MLSLIAAVNKKGVIGNKGAIPWRDADDMYRFKEITKGKICLVGRKTYENLPSSFFDGRAVVCITHDPVLGLTFERAIAEYPDAFVIGGAEVYEQAIKSGKVKYYYLSIIDNASSGDTFLPPIFFGLKTEDIIARAFKK